MEEEIECVELLAHGKPEPRDDSAYRVMPGEAYRCFYFRSPWDEPVHGVATETVIDNASVVHHWLLYDLRTPRADGSFEGCLGTHPDASLLTGWAPGGEDVTYEDDLGLRLPHGDDGYFLLEVHYINPREEAELDRSGARVCVTRQLRPKPVSVTWIGTESINGLVGIPPGEEFTAAGRCHPARAGLGPDEPIEILGVWPHMHALGRHMEIVIERTDGAIEPLLDEPFSVDDQRAHQTPASLYPGDALRIRCHYLNDTDRYVPWGPSAELQEMCYGFVLHTPAGALDNPLPSLAGAVNTCFW